MPKPRQTGKKKRAGRARPWGGKEGVKTQRAGRAGPGHASLRHPRSAGPARRGDLAAAGAGRPGGQAGGRGPASPPGGGAWRGLGFFPASPTLPAQPRRPQLRPRDGGPGGGGGRGGSALPVGERGGTAVGGVSAPARAGARGGRVPGDGGGWGGGGGGAAGTGRRAAGAAPAAAGRKEEAGGPRRVRNGGAGWLAAPPAPRGRRALHAAITKWRTRRLSPPPGRGTALT